MFIENGFIDELTLFDSPVGAVKIAEKWISDGKENGYYPLTQSEVDEFLEDIGIENKSYLTLYFDKDEDSPLNYTLCVEKIKLNATTKD